jgi:hypothetical protein
MQEEVMLLQISDEQWKEIRAMLAYSEEPNEIRPKEGKLIPFPQPASVKYRAAGGCD